MILFDAANTLIYKPSVYTAILETIEKYGYCVSLDRLKYNHKMLSEVITFPDKTNKEFYSEFNNELLISMGVRPVGGLLDDLFVACSYLPWKPFPDTSSLSELNQPMAIISNFHSNLKEIIESLIPVEFSHIVVSEELGIRKPDVNFYKAALRRMNISADNVVYVGDSLKLDVLPSIECGMRSILIDRDSYYPCYPERIQSLAQLKHYLG